MVFRVEGRGCDGDPSLPRTTGAGRHDDFMIVHHLAPAGSKYEIDRTLADDTPFVARRSHAVDPGDAEPPTGSVSLHSRGS